MAPKPELGRLLLDTLYADRPSKSNGQWVHAEDLSLSQEIAAIRINHAVFWDKIKTIELANNENELTIFLFRNNNLSEVPMNAKTSFNITKEMWDEMRPKFIISYR